MQSEEQLRAKYDQMCLAVGIGVLTCLLYLVAIQSKVAGNRIKVAEWDLNTVTVTDYSVEIEIQQRCYKEWLRTDFHGGERDAGDYYRQVSPGLSLKKHIIEQVETVLTAELKEL